ncbi:acyl-CoA N-acyltransferase [Rhodocollybia butyracea]|uniref:N-alpha-acetyltransferase 40 n=1 Tax=Rhodocollybia butyracea TaxID=206335 RepID=A0A9P5U7R2_9AGAR|nr:acyl-CoA N-acyltransferase [Rhodocollybia butyracea]
MSSDGSKVVRLANKKSAKQLSIALKDVQLPDDCTCTFYLATEIPEGSRAEIWKICEENMREMYTSSSMGWNPAEKQAELFNPLARFILLTPADKPTVIAGYTVFRFEYEEEEDLLYCYELQISNGYRRKGLGKSLVNLLESVGSRMSMEKIMLTALDVNLPALDFYTAAGFKLDPCSPTYHEEGDADDEVDNNCDYQILSKILPG